MSLTQDECVEEYKPGSIRRIKLKNFLTYTNVEFFPGPRLNMVVGPNGTGKSTILCAICLGLGGEPKLLGRADDSRLFINHEQETAVVEIELAPHSPMSQGENSEVHVFRRVIERSKGSESGRGRGASTFYINGSKSTAKEIRRIVSDIYHISVDNLCTFLPQDRVGSFSGFDAQALLIETEKSLSGSGHLYETHQKLIEAEENLRKEDNEKESIEARLKALEAENARLEREKERMEEREKALEEMDLLQKKILWLRFDEARKEAVELKEKKMEAKEALRTAQGALAPLEEKQAFLKQQEERSKARVRALEQDGKKADREMTKHKQKAEKHLDEIEEVMSTLNSIDAQQRQAERHAEQQKEKLEQLEAKQAEMPSKEEVDQAYAAAHKDFRSKQPEMGRLRQERSHLQEQCKDVEEKAKRAQQRLDRTNDERARRRDRVFRQQPKLKQVHTWVEQNRKRFRRPVWGPIVCEVNPKSKNGAAFLEQHVPSYILKSFVVECREDEQLLYREVRQGLKLPVNIVEVYHGKLSAVQRIYSENKMRTLKQEHGVMGYMDECFTAPDAVMEALRGSALIERVLIGNEKTQESIDRRGLLEYLSEREDGKAGLQGCCVFTNHNDRSYKYTSIISRYSGKAATRVDDINPARMLAPGVDPREKAELEKRVEEAKQAMDEIGGNLQAIQGRYQESESSLQEASARVKKAKHDQSEITRFQQRLNNAKRKLRELEEAAKSDNTTEKKKYLRTLMARVKSNVTALETHAECHAQMMRSTYAVAGIKISQDGVAAAVRKVSTKLAERRHELEDHSRKFDEVSARFTQARSNLKRFKDQADKEAPISGPDGTELPLKEKLEQLEVDTLEDAEAALEEASAKANSIDANPDVIRQYEERKVQIEEMREKLARVNDDNNSRIQELQSKREPWEAALTNSVEKVNVLFAKYMEELGNAGEVSLYKGGGGSNRGRGGEDGTPGNFKNWGIEIKVKFREKSSLQVLSAQVQSGGERSVSTIMYLMALQELMVSPFRCVDEINQGLDERNERLVFKRIVNNSTQPPKRGNLLSTHSGQYFLITPKLLPQMHDMENEHMTVLFVFNGRHNFKNPLDWNVKNFIESKRESESQQTAEGEEEDGADENSSSGINTETTRGDNEPQKKRRKSEETVM